MSSVTSRRDPVRPRTTTSAWERAKPGLLVLFLGVGLPILLNLLITLL